MFPIDFPHQSLDPIPMHGVAKSLRHAESNMSALGREIVNPNKRTFPAFPLTKQHTEVIPPAYNLLFREPLVTAIHRSQ